MLAAGCVLVGSAFRLTIQTVGHVHYLPMLAAVMATALVAQRPATFTAIVLSVPRRAPYRRMMCTRVMGI